MTQHKNILIKISFEKSDEAFETAKLALENNKLTSAQNRLYYAIFYALTALGYHQGFSTSKHTELLGWFNREFIYKNNIFSQEMSKISKDAYENRRKSDYEITYKPNKEDLLTSIPKTKDFIDSIKAYIVEY